MNPRKIINGYDFYPGAKIQNADLSGLDLSGLDLAEVRFHKVNLTGTNLTGTNLAHARLLHCNLSHANLTGTNLTHAHLTGSNLTDSILKDCKLMYTKLNDTNLSGLDLRDKCMPVVDMRGANLNGTLFFTPESSSKQSYIGNLFSLFTTSAAEHAEHNETYLRWAKFDACDIKRLSVKQQDENLQIMVGTANEKIEVLKPQIMEVYKGFSCIASLLCTANEDIIKCIAMYMLHLAKLDEFISCESYIKGILDCIEDIVSCEPFWKDKSNSMLTLSAYTPNEIVEIRKILISENLSSSSKLLAIKEVASHPGLAGFFTETRGKILREFCQSILDEKPEGFFRCYQGQLASLTLTDAPSNLSIENTIMF